MKSILLKCSLFSSLVLCACSPIHYTTDLNEIRGIHSKTGKQNDTIKQQRQLSIKIDDQTIYAKAIKCLSPSFTNGMQTLNQKKIADKQNEIKSINEEMQRLENDIKKITQTGNYQEIIKLQTPNQQGQYIEYGKPFEFSINQYAILIKELDTKIDFLKAKPQSQEIENEILKIIKERESIAFKFEDLKSHHQQTKKELADAKTKKEAANKILKDMSTEAQNANNVYKVAVGNIYDQTGKVFKEKSTAISEMVAHALSYNYGIKLVDTPFNNNWSDSRYNPRNDSRHSDTIKNNPAFLSFNTGFAGSVFVSDMYISGALVQYDEVPPFAPFGTRLSVNIDPLDASTETRTITVGMILRAIDSSNALILDNAGTQAQNTDNSNTAQDQPNNNNANQTQPTTGQRASTYVQNTFFVKKIGLNTFEIKSKRLYGGNITIEVSDPTTYVIKEMVEAGVYDLLKKTIRPNEKITENNQDCDSLVNPTKDTSPKESLTTPNA